MDDDERDPDLVAEVIEARLLRAKERARWMAWDEPPGFFDGEC